MIQVSNLFSNPPPPILNQTQNTNSTPQSQPFQPLQFKPFKPPDGEFDGKRLRKSVMRKTVDYNSSVIQMLESRIWQRDARDRPALPPDICYASHLLPPPAYLSNPINAVVSKFVRSSTNKAKCPIFCLAWTPEGRRLVTGASSGEFTLWNGLTFNFETILQAHESSVRAMVWSHNDQWMVTGDTSGFVKYWQSNMNNVKMFQAHKDPVRGLSQSWQRLSSLRFVLTLWVFRGRNDLLVSAYESETLYVFRFLVSVLSASFSPSDLKLATGSDDGSVRIWDFFRCQEERVLIGHGSDVKCVDWHPSKSLLASGSKDNQQPIKLWDPRSGNSLAQLHAHKSTVMDLKWNSNGTWLCSASRDHLLKLFDIRNLSTELQVFRGHKKEASSIAWHPQHEGLFASGGSDGSILFWHVGNDKEVGAIEAAHDGIIWDLAWHPLGHLLCSGSNDHSSKFWTRNRPGDKMRDKYNLNTLPPGVVGEDCVDIDDIPVHNSFVPSAAIPGMGPDDRVEAEPEPKGPETIPGLDFDSLAFDRFLKKTPYAKPIPKTFQAAWNAAGGLDDDIEDDQSVTSWVIVESENLFNRPANLEGNPVKTLYGEELPPGSVPLSQVKANAIAYFGFYIPLPKVTGQAIQDAFAFFDEEEAIAEITNDPEFARKLIREKRGLYNPSINQGLDEPKTEQEIKKEPFHKHSSQQHHDHHRNLNSSNNNMGMGNDAWSNYNNKRQQGNFAPNFRQNNFNQQQPNHGLNRPTPDFPRGGQNPQRFPYQGERDNRSFKDRGDRGRAFPGEDGERGRDFPMEDGDRGRGFERDEGRERGRGRGGFYRDRDRERESNRTNNRNFRDGNDRPYYRDDGEEGSTDNREAGDGGRGWGGGGGRGGGRRGKNLKRNKPREFNDSTDNNRQRGGNWRDKQNDKYFGDKEAFDGGDRRGGARGGRGGRGRGVRGQQGARVINPWADGNPAIWEKY